MALRSLFTTTIGGKALTGSTVSKIVLDMCIQKKRRKHEIEKADEHANDPGNDVNLWLMAYFQKTCLITQICLTFTEAIFNDISH